MFSPSFIYQTSYRFDTILIYFLLPFLVLFKPRLSYLKINIYLIFAVGVFVLSIFIALFLQCLFIPDASLSKQILNFAGFFRILLFSIFALFAINSYERALIVAKTLLICIVFQSLIIIIDYTQIYPLSNIVNILYHGGFEKSIVYRATGTFSSVHGAAYFFLYSLLFSVSIYFSISTKSIKKLSLLAILLSLIGVTLPASKSAFIALFASLVFFVILCKNYKALLITPILILTLIVGVYCLAPKKKIEYLAQDLSQLKDGISWFFNSRDISYDEVGFIAGRLNHGWKNAIDNWLNYPIYGNIDVTDIVGNFAAFAALREDGSVVTWGDPLYGGDSYSVATDIDGTIDVVNLFKNNSSWKY